MWLHAHLCLISEWFVAQIHASTFIDVQGPFRLISNFAGVPRRGAGTAQKATADVLHLGSPLSVPTNVH
jgi:hypothetical protein